MDSTQYWKKAALQASRSLNLIDTKLIDQVLSALADAAEANATQILAANAKDLAAMDKTNPMYDRLLLTEERIAGIAAAALGALADHYSIETVYRFCAFLPLLGVVAFLLPGMKNKR